MILLPFNRIFPEIGERETRVIHIFKDDRVPCDSYALMEYYCPEPESDCDCRKADITVINQRGETFARLSCGWEEQTFYSNYFSEGADSLPDPCYAPLQPQSKYAWFFLEILQSLWTHDANYKARVKRHYEMIKQEANKKDLLRLYGPEAIARKSERVAGRNDPCVCGSGIKYKKCCVD